MSTKDSNDTTIRDFSDSMEFFLAEDIIQGEEVPFYILWQGDNPREIKLELEGFGSINKLYNTIESETTVEGNRAVITGFHVPGYLGGVLSTNTTNQPIIYGSLAVKIVGNDGTTKSLKETRKLHTTQITIDIPEIIHYTNSGADHQIVIDLKGDTTVFLDIEDMEGNECYVDLPPDVKEAVEKFSESVDNGMSDLKEQFPDHIKTIERRLTTTKSSRSYTELIEKVEEVSEELLKDKDFYDAVTTVFLTALFEQVSIKDRILRPLTEYFEYSAAERAYFLNPLLHIRIPKEGGQMAVRVIGKNILQQECGIPLEIRVFIKAKEDVFKPVKDIFSIRRNVNG